MFGSIGDYLYYGLAGINPVMDEPGFKLIKLNPQFPEELTYLKSGHKTTFGWIKTHWKKEEGKIDYELFVPENTRAELTFPEPISNIRIADEEIDQLDEIEILDKGTGLVKMRITSGEYMFEINQE
jgi:alpha-L-rhamnosidase